MTVKDLQKRVATYFREAFKTTPLNQRIDDILSEVLELKNHGTVRDIRSEFGDLLASVLAGIDECGFDAEELIAENEQKIRSRQKQYKSLGRKIRVAILGGAFDPITVGHIALAKFVLNASKQFDEVWIMPCFSHMYGKDMASPGDRISMIKLALRDEDRRIRLFPFEIENELAGETYHFAKCLADDPLSETHNFSMIIGMDNANTFSQWVNYIDLERMMRFVVVHRPGQTPDPNVDWYLNGRHIYLKPDENSGLLETSSTQVRQGVSGQTDWTHLVSPLVAKYIEQNGLYKVAAQ